VAPADQTELFIRKLQQCSVVFDFNDASADLQGKGIKGQALHEMLEYITTPRVAIPEQVYVEVIGMVSLRSKEDVSRAGELTAPSRDSFCLSSSPRTSSDRFLLKSTLQEPPSTQRKTILS